MARIPLIYEDDPSAPPQAVEFLRSIEQTRGSILNIHRAFANHPKVAQAFFGFSNAVRIGNHLTPAQTELAYTTATVANSCYY